MLKNFLLQILFATVIVALIAYFKTGLTQEGASQAFFAVSAIYICVGGLMYVTSSERKIIDDLGRKKGMNENELKHLYRNVSTTQSSGYPWGDAFGGNIKYLTSGRQSAGLTILVGLIALFVAVGLSRDWT